MLFQEQHFYLYALYNKNKPKSDYLMQEYGHAFFKVFCILFLICIWLGLTVYEIVLRWWSYIFIFHVKINYNHGN